MEVLRQAKGPAEDAHVGREHGGHRRGPPQRGAGRELWNGVAGADEDQHIGDPVWQIVEDLSGDVCSPSSTASIPSRRLHSRRS